MTDGGTNTLALHGLEELFSSCAVVSVFWFWREIGFGVTYVLRVQYSCGIVLVFWFLREIVFGVIHVFRVQYSCAVVSVFWLWQEIVLKIRTPFDSLWAVSTKISYWVSLLYYDPLADDCISEESEYYLWINS
jgi:hypothetical protein